MAGSVSLSLCGHKTGEMMVHGQAWEENRWTGSWRGIGDLIDI